MALKNKKKQKALIKAKRKSERWRKPSRWNKSSGTNRAQKDNQLAMLGMMAQITGMNDLDLKAMRALESTPKSKLYM
jgi:hypothetical protein